VLLVALGIPGDRGHFWGQPGWGIIGGNPFNNPKNGGFYKCELFASSCTDSHIDVSPPRQHVSTNGGFNLVDGFNDFITSPGVVNFSAGVGDVLTFGLTRGARDLWDIGSVDTTAGTYHGGEVVGVVGSLGVGYRERKQR
jgi:hypothetical protein